MDPNEALRDLLESARMIIATSEDELALKVADGVLHLHDWLSQGGTPPTAWALMT